jgi:hypothetical protein
MRYDVLKMHRDSAALMESILPKFSHFQESLRYRVFEISSNKNIHGESLIVCKIDGSDTFLQNWKLSEPPDNRCASKEQSYLKNKCHDTTHTKFCVGTYRTILTMVRTWNRIGVEIFDITWFATSFQKDWDVFGQLKWFGWFSRTSPSESYFVGFFKFCSRKKIVSEGFT